MVKTVGEEIFFLKISSPTGDKTWVEKKNFNFSSLPTIFTVEPKSYYIMPNNYTELIAVNDVIEANLLLSTLESQGIEAYLKDENTINANPMYAQAIGGIRIMVKQDQYEIAHQIVQEIRATDTPPIASEEVDEEWEEYQKQAAIGGRKATIATYVVAGFFALLIFIVFIALSIEGCFG